jgi:hypothetical protein
LWKLERFLWVAFCLRPPPPPHSDWAAKDYVDPKRIGIWGWVSRLPILISTWHVI